uniref:Uncharacterized protein n=1 Tax=Anguilla anguilla TaxID=7936 RepID=A0A0E9UQ86_ANGAN
MCRVLISLSLHGLNITHVFLVYKALTLLKSQNHPCSIFESLCKPLFSALVILYTSHED